MSASEQGQHSDPSAGTGTGTTNMETGSGAAVEPDEPTGTAVATTIAPITQLHEIRARVMPILEPIQREYTGRVRQGYPLIVDNIEQGGVFGITLDPGWAVYFMTDGTSVFAERHLTSLRTDTLSMANAEKFAASPDIERRDIDDTWRDSDFRNLISELLHFWNYQQLRIYRVDS